MADCDKAFNIPCKLDVESCDTQCQRMAYTCSVAIDADFCMCGLSRLDVPGIGGRSADDKCVLPSPPGAPVCAHFQYELVDGDLTGKQPRVDGKPTSSHSPTPFTQDVLLSLKYHDRRTELKWVTGQCKGISGLFSDKAEIFDYIGTPSLYSGPSMPDCTLEGLVATTTQAMHAGEIYEVTVKLRTPTLVQIFASSLFLNHPETFEDRECTDQEVHNPMFRTCAQKSVSDPEGIYTRGIKQDSLTTSPSMPCTVVMLRCTLIVDANFSGFQIFQPRKLFIVEIGERIGLPPANLEAIDCTSSTETAPADFVYLVPPSSAIQEGKKVLTLIRLVGKRYKIFAAVATSPSSMLFKGRFETLGIKRVIATVYTDTHSTMPLARTSERIINVVSPLEVPKLSWSIFTADKGEVLQLTVSKDGKVIYKWDSGAGSPVETTLAREICHVFQRTGSLSLSLGVENAFESAIHTFPIKVYETVSLGALTAVSEARTLGSRKPIDFIVTVITGAWLTFIWFVGGGLVEETATPKAIIAFDHAANYTITLNASNCISWQEAQTSVEIVAPIRGVSLECDSIPAAVESCLNFVYSAGLPVSGEASIDSGAWSPVKLEPRSRSVHSSPVPFNDIGRHQVAVTLTSARGSVQENFDI
ncbi:unnamed protein product [Taenia asiatica]|uniref:PKD_channel domain-containing protein n=1 Tax=Taenia asiatica TaxID=60517 RepID=A0A0R3VWE5_TAEAS|nr:unnamed protein product [Taenia asiatica]